MACASRVEDFDEDPIGRRNPAQHALEQLPVRSPKPAQLRGPKGRTQHAPGRRMDFSFVKSLAQSPRIPRGARIRPSENWRQRLSVSIKTEKSVPEGAAADSDNGLFCAGTLQRPVQASSDRLAQCGRRKFGAAVGCVLQRVLPLRLGSNHGPAPLVEQGRPRRGAANVDRENEHFTSASPRGPAGVSTAPSTPRWRATLAD